MSTTAVVNFKYSLDAKNSKTTILSLFKKFDAHPAGLGESLLKSINRFELVNRNIAIKDASERTSKGADELALQVACELKKLYPSSLYANCFNPNNDSEITFIYDFIYKFNEDTNRDELVEISVESPEIIRVFSGDTALELFTGYIQDEVESF